MPEKILNILSKEDDSNNSCDVIPALANLLKSSHDLDTAYLCTPHAVQVSKIPNEGGHFCGYRNIQMLWLSLPQEFKKQLAPGKSSIPEIQHMIEQAWDAGINAHGRVQTGGIKNTRKHIGTSEASGDFFNLITNFELTTPPTRQKHYFYNTQSPVQAKPSTDLQPGHNFSIMSKSTLNPLNFHQKLATSTRRPSHQSSSNVQITQ